MTTTEVAKVMNSTDRELIDRAKRMCLTMKGARMGMPGVGQKISMGVESVERLTALAFLGEMLLEVSRGDPDELREDVRNFVETLVSDWTEKTHLLVGQVTDTKTGETS